MHWLTLLALIAFPVVMVAVDTGAQIRASLRKITVGTRRSDDFTVLVPIWGNIAYLETVDYLAAYGNRVTLCTTGDESAEFMAALHALAASYQFQLFVDATSRTDTHRARTNNQRATSGTIRDRLVRNAVQHVTTRYVIPLDADTSTVRPLDELAGALERSGNDLASIRLVPAKAMDLLTKLQRLEYRLAMQFRLLSPWMVSGACHIAKTTVLRDVMNHHSLFFQGNDVETGLIAVERGYRVGHIPFEVTTTVPASPKAWLRQRLAWSGGEFRLFIVNIRFALHHPLLWTYGAVITILAVPLRWWALTTPAWPLAVIGGLYLVMAVYQHRKGRSGWMLLMPVYTLLSSLVLTPLGLPMYLYMAIKDGNWGLIRPHRTGPAL